jgi:hypothetical protein
MPAKKAKKKSDNTFRTADGVDAISEDQIFLQDRDDEDRFSRTIAFEQELTSTFNPALGFYDIGEITLLIFEKTMDDGEPLIQSMDDELELVIPTQDAGDFELRFKVEDLVELLDQLGVSRTRVSLAG